MRTCVAGDADLLGRAESCGESLFGLRWWDWRLSARTGRARGWSGLMDDAGDGVRFLCSLGRWAWVLGRGGSESEETDSACQLFRRDEMWLWTR